MKVFRITTIQWSKKLSASGYPARWNAKGNFIIYTAESRSLACLENLVHRSGEGENSLYKVLVIDIPETLSMEVIETSALKKDWYSFDNYADCQSIGARWLNDAKCAVLKVPSIIIKKENNYLINPNHADFKHIKLTATEDFEFDDRF